MNISDYQTMAGVTATDFDGDVSKRLMVSALGLTGEAGEFADIVKKYAYGKKLDRTHAAEELGDVLWYLAEAATSLGLDLQTIAQDNIDKLRKRHGKKFYPDFYEEALKEVE